MLKSLIIKNIATIESIVVEFTDGFNVLTGETGAGKSIVVGGLELALGERLGGDVIRGGENLAVAEACFSPPFNQKTEDLLPSELNIEYAADEPIVLRREISRTGKNRCFINNQMVNLADLKRIGEFFVDLHGQHEHQSLLHAESHLRALDSFAGHERLVSDYQKAWEKVTRLRRRKKELDLAAEDFERHMDFVLFQIEEIEKINPQPGEIPELELEEQRLAHAESLALTAAEAYAILEEESGEDQRSLLAQITEISHRVAEIARVEKEFESTAASLEEMRFMLQDFSSTFRAYAEKTQPDPERLNIVIARLESLRRLLRKHGGSEETLFSALDSLRKQRDQMTHDDEERKGISEELSRAEAAVLKAGDRLRDSRKKAAERLRKKILSLLREMAMEKGEFEVQMESLEEPSPTGLNRIEFLLTANPGLPAAPLRKIASGGELSRVMLSLKSTLAERDAIPTLVFDEIDAGISGEICRRVAKVMETLASTHQILCITHQPAIAARARTHFSVRKSTRGGKTYTELVRVEGASRLEELARMMGTQDSRAALALARQLMS